MGYGRVVRGMGWHRGMGPGPCLHCASTVSPLWLLYHPPWTPLWLHCGSTVPHCGPGAGHCGPGAGHGGPGGGHGGP